jgi:hypothetical protein
VGLSIRPSTVALVATSSRRRFFKIFATPPTTRSYAFLAIDFDLSCSLA